MVNHLLHFCLREKLQNSLIKMRYRSNPAFQYGGNIPYFQGGTFQRGYGLGSIFKKLSRSFAPVLKEGLIKAGKKALVTGSQVVGDMASGKSFKESIKTRSKENAKQLLNDVVSGIGKSKRIKPVKKNKSISRKRAARGGRTKAAKRRKPDIFDL